MKNRRPRVLLLALLTVLCTACALVLSPAALAAPLIIIGITACCASATSAPSTPLLGLGAVLAVMSATGCAELPVPLHQPVAPPRTVLEERWATDWFTLGVMSLKQDEDTPEQLDAFAAHLDAMAADARALAAVKRGRSRP